MSSTDTNLFATEGSRGLNFVLQNSNLPTVDASEEDVVEEKKEDLLEGVDAMNTFAVFDWSKVVGVTSNLKYGKVFFDNGHDADVQIPWFLESDGIKILLTTQFAQYLNDKKEKDCKRAETLDFICKKLYEIELALLYAPNDAVESEFNKAKIHFHQILDNVK